MSKTKLNIQEEIIAIMEGMTKRQLEQLQRLVKKLAGVESVHVRIIREWEDLK